MKNITLQINGREVEVVEGITVLEAAEKLEIKIPTLCAHKALVPYGACRVCLVEITQEGRSASLQTACTYPAFQGLIVETETERVLKTRRIMVELLLSKCPDAETIQELAKEIGVKSGRIAQKNEDCILCGLCVRMCKERMGRSAIDFVGRGLDRKISSPFGKHNEMCQTCGACDFICPTGKKVLADASNNVPVPISSEFNKGLVSRSPVHILYPQAVPNAAIIDDKYCVKLLTGECGICKEVCEAEAINYDHKEEFVDIDAGAVVLTSGVELFDANERKEYGYDRYDNVVTSIQFERLLSSSGPTKGEILRPSDNKPPKKIAFIQCVGSRDPSCGNEFCSSVCCMYSIKEAVIAKEHDPQIEPTIFYIDMRTFGKDFEYYLENAKKSDVNFVRCMISKIFERSKSKNLVVKYRDEAGKMREDEFDLVTLAVGMTGSKKNMPLIEKLGIDKNEYGFCNTSRNAPCVTSREGVYIAGTQAEPKDIPETVAEGSSSAALVSALLADVRGSLVKEKEYPPERDVTDEEVRIGVFICRCGRNIASVVNVPEVVEYASKLDGVAYASEFLYSCSKDALDVIKRDIAEHDLNRVVVASCTPRTHEELFRDTVREAGLNRYLFEMTSLREQVAWVHKGDPKWATEKSKGLVSMMVAKTRYLKPLERKFADVISSALIVGGGAAGMQAALYIAKQGFEVHLVEKESSLGGHLREIFYNLDDADSQAFLKKLTEDVLSNKKINVLTDSTIKTLSGFTGNFKSIINSKGKEREIEHGVVVVAAGANKYEPKPGEYGYGKSDKIIRQLELEEQLENCPEKFSKPQTFVMVQCVGSRNDEHPYCSRVCCGHAVKNALKLKEINPEHKVTVLYRDIRTYGFLEKYYLKAREAGVIFSRFDKEEEPKVDINSGKIIVKHIDKMLNETISFNPDWLVLSSGIAPGDNEELTKILKVPLNADGFFLEAHAKIRPLDFTAEGMYVCGLAHSPRYLHEALSQAQGASVRAVTILSKDKMEAKAITAAVNERVCKGCGLCVSVCPYDAREIDEETNVAKVIEVQCQGCGACCAACPSGASTHKGFSKKQIMAAIEEGI